MAHRRTLLVPSLIFLILAAVFFYIAARYSGVEWKAAKKLFSPVSRSSSWSILEEIRQMEELETAVYDMKVVFPFDFTGNDEVDWAGLKIEYDWSPEQFLQKADPAMHPGGILPREWKYAELYAKCREAGIDPGRPDSLFVVISAQVSAGVDVNAWLAGLEAGDSKQMITGIVVTETEKGGRSLALAAPPVHITSFVVEDRNFVAEGFPDVPLSPEEWSRLVGGLEPALLEMAEQGGLIERAGDEARRFLVEVFEAAGYDSVEFIEN